MTHPRLDIATRLVHAGERLRHADGPACLYTHLCIDDVHLRLPWRTPMLYWAVKSPDTFTHVMVIPPSLLWNRRSCRWRAGSPPLRMPSGMAALHAAVLACELSPGSTILASQDLYGATQDLLVLFFGQFDIKTVTADFSDLPSLAAKAQEVRPRMLIAETISNPLLKICDIDACAEIAHAHHARLIVDNTFATPFLCRPLEHGARFRRA